MMKRMRTSVRGLNTTWTRTIGFGNNVVYRPNLAGKKNAERLV